MSNNVNLSLDDLIIDRRRTGGGGNARNGVGAGRRAGGGGRGGGMRSDTEQRGKWKHDKFDSLYGGNGVSPRRRSGGAGGGGPSKARGGAGGGAGAIVKLNISDLPETVLTADLEELFQDFTIYGVTVHYNETGEHLGTADLFVSPRAAKDILREYANIAIDGQEIRIGVVDETGSALAPRARIQERIRRVANNPIRRRKETAPRPARGGGGGGGTRGSFGGGAKKAGTGGKPPKKNMTAEELDKELESYMGSRHPQITM